MELTRSEEKLMQVLWKMGRGFIKDIIPHLNEDPAPAYTTVSTIIRILEQKGFVAHNAFGKSHEYYPLVSKAEYRRQSFGNLVKNYFDSNAASLLSYMVQEENLTDADIAEVKNIIARTVKQEKL
jgi:BlaI family transcriptional regulator, penicillinase repressor